MWRLGDTGGPLGVASPPSSHPFPSATHRGSIGTDLPGSDPDYIMQLVSDVRRFADVLLLLKDAFRSRENHDCLHAIVHDRLGELLRVLKAVIGKHQTLNSVDILSAAGIVIAKVKGVNFKDVNEDNKKHIFGEIYTSIDTLAFTFGNVVSDFLMGDVDSGSVLGGPQTRSRVSERLSCLGSVPCPPPRCVCVCASFLFFQHVMFFRKQPCPLPFVPFSTGTMFPLSLPVYFEYMPFREIYTSAFNNDYEYGQLLLQTAAALQANKFIQPLLARRNELDKRRKEIKDQWQKEQKKLQEADSALRKARALQGQRREEYEKAHCSTSRMEEEAPQAGGKQLEKKRRLEEEALQKAEEANDQYKACVADLGMKKQDAANTKSEILAQVHDLVFQCDLTLKAVTVNWFQMQQAQAVSLPVNHQALCESAKRYEPGRRYAEFVQSLSRDRLRPGCFSSDAPQNSGVPFGKRSAGSVHSSHGNLSQMSITSSDFQSTEEVDSPGHTRAEKAGEGRANSSADIQALRTQGPLRGWSTGGQGGGMCSDSESAGGSSESRSMDSPTASPGDFKRRLPRTPSTGTMSSADDLDEREPPSPSDNGLGEMVMETASSPGPFRNAQMSKAAQTHKLRKLRAPSKCRECDSLVVFHGAECEECSLACHKKCLETLAIQCGHKKLQGKLHLFGVDFALAAKSDRHGVPFIIKKCTSEIENRALGTKGIYRVNGAKSRVEKLCQAFENGKDLVELSDHYPHDISNVLKLYLRQLPEPLILFRFYNDFIGLAKESQSAILDEVDAARSRPAGDTPQLSVELNRVLFKIRDLLRQLPLAHYRTLQYLIGHLNRVTEKADENKMTASNLGIIFGPTLIKPRQTDAEVSLSSLVDYPYQALIVELLITHYGKIFDTPLSPMSPTPTGSLLALRGPEVLASSEEPHLSHHSKSLVDIKEQSSKAYKRHSSIIPTFRSVDEVKDTKPRLEGGDYAPAVVTSSAKFNGAPGPAVPEIHRTMLVLEKQHISTARVQLRAPRSKPVSRPVSMPVERLLGPSQVLERNNKNSSQRERSPAIQEAPEPEKPGNRVSSYYRSPYIDTQTLRKTWDKQYKHYDITPRTAMIMANIPTDGSAGDSGNLSTSLPATTFSMPERTGRTLRRQNNLSEPCPGSGNVIRPPRTLRPPPGTFYKPPPSQKAKPAELEARRCSEPASIPIDAGPSQGLETQMGVGSEAGLQRRVSADEPMESEPAASQPHSQPQSPISGPEDQSVSEAKPVFQRLRTRRVPEFEHREAHFV
nr:rho GTPase-activating protein 29-like [Paramormyrops kingsleyae]